MFVHLLFKDLHHLHIVGSNVFLMLPLYWNIQVLLWLDIKPEVETYCAGHYWLYSYDVIYTSGLYMIIGLGNDFLEFICWVVLHSLVSVFSLNFQRMWWLCVPFFCCWPPWLVCSQGMPKGVRGWNVKKRKVRRELFLGSTWVPDLGKRRLQLVFCCTITDNPED